MPMLPLFRPLLLVLALLVALGPTAGRAHEEHLSNADLKLYRAAFAAVKKARWAEARGLAARAKNPLPAKIIQWLDLTRPGPGRSFAELTAFLEANPDWPGQITMQAQAERATPEDISADAVLRWYGTARRPVTVNGTMQLARALLARGRAEEGTALLRAGWIEHDMTAADEIRFLSRFKQYLKPEDHVARLDRLLWDREAEQARRMMDRVGAGHRALADARLRLMNMQGGVDAALARVPPSLLRDPGLIYDRAQWRRRKGQGESAIELLDPPPAGARRPEQLWKEMESAARLALARGDVSVAYRLAKSHGTSEGVSFADGEWLAGWIALRFLQEEKAAYEHFARLYDGVTSSISRSRGAYWAGRAAEEMGDRKLAESWYRKAAAALSTFYGQLAAQRFDDSQGLVFPTLPEPTGAERTGFAKRELVRVVRLLGHLGEEDRARPFLTRLSEVAQTPAEHRMIIDLAHELERDDFAVATAKAARQKGVELIEHLFPLRRVPKQAEPEDALVLGIVRQESAFATDAVSPAGARGLMQLMPGTAKQVAKSLKLRYSEAKLTSDPEFNIRLGSAYLNQLLGRFGGSYVLAVAAYNAGPSRVAEWMRLYGDPREADTDAIDWVETIPFSETRNYVQRVLENLQVYRYRLNGKAFRLALEQDLGRRPGS